MNFRTLDLNLLRVFDAVMVERNVTRAAARLAMSQPAVSNALRRLRDATGEDLFVPGSTGMAPTPHAQALWPAVRAAMDALRGAFDSNGFDPRHDERCFTLCMADATADVLLPALVGHVQRERLRVDLRVLPLATRDPRPQIDQGLADAAVGFFPDVEVAQATEGGKGMTVLDALYACEYVCVMRAGHPLAGEGELMGLDAYCSAHHLRVSFAGRQRGFVDEALARLGRRRRVVMTVSHFSTAACVVRDSDLLTVLPRSFVPATGFAQSLAVRPLPFAVPAIEVGLLWHRRHERDAGQRWLRDAVVQAARAVDPG
ncbi:LysR family transcriptional regulator [Piscinibacter sp. XHJ-5]|uniref:LysR family transcriptional regulator n=1 Tax=Piscinibacter sp. XHJ-5 TaxID=3037797 RepID=UPI0024532EBA|nr:LysR family transcriptional regulator [Piscinibacter sp. XHJ-5]